MPSTFTHLPPETERRDTGIGGKPPLDRRPTGGGGGGGDDEGKNERRGPRERLSRIRFFLFSALAADMLVFAALVLFFYASQSSIGLNPRTHRFAPLWHPVSLPPVLYLNTALLLLSCLTMERARQHIFREFDVLEEWLGLGRPALNRTVPWVAATLLLGGLFLAGQMTAWSQLTARGFAFDRGATPASYFFYLITGLHAAHLALGVLALTLCLTALSWLKRVEYRQIAIDITAWYWHAMGLAWLFLFAVLTLGQ